MKKEEAMETVRKIEGLAEDVLADSEYAKEAFFNEARAEATLLVLMMRAVEPVLEALCSRVVQYQKPGFEPDYFTWRGVLLEGGVKKKEGGIVRGSALYLDHLGHLRVVSYSGMWTTAGEEEWVAMASDGVDPSVPAYTDVIKPMLRYDVRKVAENLAEALRRQADGRKAQVAERAARLADRMQAIATLLEVGS